MTDPIELAREYASRPELWEHLVHHDPGQRTFELLRDDDEVTVKRFKRRGHNTYSGVPLFVRR